VEVFGEDVDWDMLRVEKRSSRGSFGGIFKTPVGWTFT